MPKRQKCLTVGCRNHPYFLTSKRNISNFNSYELTNSKLMLMNIWSQRHAVQIHNNKKKRWIGTKINYLIPNACLCGKNSRRVLFSTHYVSHSYERHPQITTYPLGPTYHEFSWYNSWPMSTSKHFLNSDHLTVRGARWIWFFV